jgi:nucleoside diphosphate kinase
MTKIISDNDFAELINSGEQIQEDFETDGFRIRLLKLKPYRVEVTDKYYHNSVTAFSLKEALYYMRNAHMSEIESRMKRLRKTDHIIDLELRLGL